MNNESLMKSRLYDLLTYIIETAGRDNLKNELIKISMTPDEYNNPELIPWDRVCELVWIMEKYIDVRGDNRKMDSKQYIKFKQLCAEKYPRLFED